MIIIDFIFIMCFILGIAIIIGEFIKLYMEFDNNG